MPAGPPGIVSEEPGVGDPVPMPVLPENGIRGSPLPEGDGPPVPKPEVPVPPAIGEGEPKPEEPAAVGPPAPMPGAPRAVGPPRGEGEEPPVAPAEPVGVLLPAPG